MAGRAIDKPPRKAVRAVLRFVRDRGEVVGRGADKGLEDVGTWAVKLVFGLLLALLFTYCGIRLSQ